MEIGIFRHCRHGNDWLFSRFLVIGKPNEVLVFSGKESTNAAENQSDIQP